MKAIFFVICLISGFVYAQKVVGTLTLGPKEPKPVWFEYCRADQGLVTIGQVSKNSSRQMGLYKYGANFEREWQKNLYENGANTELEQLFVAEEHIYSIISDVVSSEKLKKYYLYHHDLDGKELEKGVKIWSTPTNQEENEPKFIQSLNRKVLLAYYPVKSKDPKINYLQIQASTDSIYSGSIELPLKNEQWELRQAVVSNAGNIFLLVKFFAKSKNKYPSDFQYFVYKYVQGDTVLTEIPLQTSGKFFTDVIIKADRDESLKIAGFYSEKDEDRVIGLLYMSLDAVNYEVQTQAFDKFDNAFLSRFLSQRQMDKGREISDLYLDNMVLRSDGGALLFAEQYYQTSTMTRDYYGFMQTRTVHHYDDVVIFSIGPNGKTEWNAVVNKEQANTSTIELSYVPLVSSDKILIVYKDFLRNLGENVYYREVEINESGAKVSNPKPILDKGLSNSAFQRSSSEQISNSEAILTLFTGRGRTFSFIKLQF